MPVLYDQWQGVSRLLEPRTCRSCRTCCTCSGCDWTVGEWASQAAYGQIRCNCGAFAPYLSGRGQSLL